MTRFRAVLAAAICGVIAGTAARAEPPKSEAGGAKGDMKSDVAATVGGQPITTTELDAKALKTNMKLAQSLYDARKAALDDVILEKLLAADAAAKKVPVEQVIKEKLAEKAKPVTDSDIDGYFKANAQRMGNRTLEQVSPQIRDFLNTQRQKEARDALLSDLKSKTEVKIALEPPRVEVPLGTGEPQQGPATAKVTIVEWSDFQ